MALDPLELGIIALMGIAVFIWGPEKIPEIAKQIASARKQLNVYTNQLSGITKEIQNAATTGNIDNLGNVLSNIGGAAPATAPAPGSPAAQAAGVTAVGAVAATPAMPAGTVAEVEPTILSADEMLIKMAHNLGITTQGKTRDELQNEILVKSSQPADATPPTVDASTGTEQIVGSDLV